ncbi:MAG: sugar nucleotide-binding protein [Nitrospirae bacterium]|nr:sugar nucleotide-binding protein [Nitrospirota bacterium]
MVEEKFLFTGGSGLLCGEIRKLLPNSIYPSSAEFNIESYEQMVEYVKGREFINLFHAAAFTSPPAVDRDPLKAIDTNIIGTANVVKLCARYSLKLVYVSTDYVFRGDIGNYKEEDPVYPVNKYAWSKLGGECAVRMYSNSLIIRTTFGPNSFPYEKAFIDQWTSRESVSLIARKIVNLLAADIKGVIHIGGNRRTVFEYAKSLDDSHDVKELSIRDVSFKVPEDTSLDHTRYDAIIEGL